MKKEEVPQDKSNLASANIREMVYAVDKDGVMLDFGSGA